MSTPTSNMALLKGVDADNAEVYLTVTLAAALDTIDTNLRTVTGGFTVVTGGLTVTAVHNHLLRAQPATFYMHVAGHGDPEKLATALHAAIAESKIPLAAAAAPATPPPIDLDTAKLNEILGARGNPNGAISCQVFRSSVLFR